jgi:hypothetical protein
LAWETATRDRRGQFGCAVLMAGTVHCWGSDFLGELGDRGPPSESENSPST